MDKFSELKAAALAATPGPWMKIDYFWIGRAGAINSEFITCDNGPDAGYIKRVSPDVVLALLAELEAKAQCITGLERHVKDIEATLIAATDEVTDLTKERDVARDAIAALYKAVIGEHPEWSNWFACLDDVVAEVATKLESKDKRIAELESDLGLKHIRAVEEALIFATDRNSELEAKLATPVRLPAKLQWSYDDGITKDEVYSFNNAIDACDVAICKAGFTVSEG